MISGSYFPPQMSPFGNFGSSNNVSLLIQLPLKRKREVTYIALIIMGDLTNVLSFYLPKSCFRILILYLKFSGSIFSFSGDITTLYVMIYNCKTCMGFLCTDLDSKLK